MKLKKFLFEPETLRLMLITISTKPLGLFSQALIAGYFGASGNYDAYNFALFLVTFLGLTVGRVFSTVAIPLIIKEKKNLPALQIAGYQNFLIVLFFVPVVLLLFWMVFFGNLAVNLVGAKLPPETQAAAYKFVRLMALPAILMSFVSVLKPILNLNKKFQIPAFLPAIHILSIIFSILLFHGRFDVYSLAIGFTISYAIQVPLLMTQAFKTGSMALAPFYIPKGSLSLLWGLSWMIILTQTILMVNTFVDRWFAAGLVIGSISSLTYSTIIVNFVLQVFSRSLIVVMFTKMSEFFSTGAISQCDVYIRKNLNKVANVVVPLSVALFLASPEVVKILFQRGAFDEIAANRTSATLAMYMLGLPAMAINGLISRVFHSLQKIREKIWLAVQYLISNIIGNYLLVKSLGTVGLAISSTVAINLHLFLSFLVLFNYRNGLKIGPYFYITIRAYFMGAICIGLAYYFNIDARLWGLVGGEHTLFNSMVVAAAKAVFTLGLFGIQFYAVEKTVMRKKVK